jgi:pyridoxamine 5'-phosphate oxidase family protein
VNPFTESELVYLQAEPRFARLATVGPDGTPYITPVGWSYNAELATIDVGGRDFARTKRFRGVVRSGRAAIVVDDVLPPWQPRGVEIRREAEAVGGVLGHRAAGILSGVGLAGEFIFFPLSGFTPTTFNDPAAAMTFLRSGSVVRAAVLFGAFGIVVTLIFPAGLANRLKDHTPTPGSCDAAFRIPRQRRRRSRSALVLDRHPSVCGVGWSRSGRGTEQLARVYGADRRLPGLWQSLRWPIRPGGRLGNHGSASAARSPRGHRSGGRHGSNSERTRHQWPTGLHRLHHRHPDGHRLWDTDAHAAAARETLG